MTEDEEQAPYLIEDGFGSVWLTHGPACTMHVVRPGKVQCDCPDPRDEDRPGVVELMGRLEQSIRAARDANVD